VDGEYVGPLEPDDAGRLMADLEAGRPALKDRQLRYRKCADPGVSEGADEFSAPDAGPGAATAGLPDQEIDRPGPTAAIEVPTDEVDDR
jgi:hypothetical protein